MNHFITEDFWNSSRALSYVVPDAMLSFSETGWFPVISSPEWVAGYSGLPVSGDIFCSGGRGYFSGNNFISISSGIPDGDWTAIILCDGGRAGNVDGLLLSSSCGKSGFDFGFNDAGLLFFEYYNEIEGRMGVSYPFPPGAKSFVSVSKTDDSLLIGSLNLNNFKINTYSYAIPGGLFNYSDRWFLGGSYCSNAANNYSGYIDEFLLITGVAVGEMAINEIFFGMISSSNITEISGSVSGVTGMIGSGGHTVEARLCSYSSGLSGIETLVGTHVSGYSFSGTDFIDFNGEVFREYVYSPIYADTINSSVIPYGENVSCYLYTGNAFFNYDSGYSIDFKIIKKEPYSVDYNKILDFYMLPCGISAAFMPFSDVSFSLIAFTGNMNSSGIFNKGLKFSNIASRYFIEYTDVTGNSFDLYRNGILQSTGEKYIERNGYDVSYTTSGDYFIDDKYINGLSKDGISFSNKDSVFFDSYMCSTPEYFISTGILSGENFPFSATERDLIFLNGQLLRSGCDFSGDIFLINDSGIDNILIKKTMIDGCFRKDFDDFNGFDFPQFILGSSQFFINGVRQSLGYDYLENSKFIDFASPSSNLVNIYKI